VPAITHFNQQKERAKRQVMHQQVDGAKGVVMVMEQLGSRLHAHCRAAYSHECVKAFKHALYSTDERSVAVPCEARTAKLFRRPTRCAKHTATTCGSSATMPFALNFVL
jgi:hypothetical protein